MTPEAAIDLICDRFGDECEVFEMPPPLDHGAIASCTHCGRSTVTSFDGIPIHARCWSDYRTGRRMITAEQAVGAYARRKKK